MVAIGAHVDSADPVAAARAAGADVAQFFLADPQGWKAPLQHPRAAEITASGLTIYIHAPYIVNVATMNNKIRIPSRKILGQHAKAATEIGARALIVHGGHVLNGDDYEAGFDNWRKTFSRAQDDGGFGLPILIENTAGGQQRHRPPLRPAGAALGRQLANSSPDSASTPVTPTPGARISPASSSGSGRSPGRIDLLHANNSRDPFDSGADRHANFTAGTIDPAQIAEVCVNAGCDLLVETPADGHRADIDYLRQALGAVTAR